MQGAAIRAAGLPLTYTALDVRDNELADLAALLCADGVAGNVTIPHKESFAALCARRTPLAAHVGAVNTFWCEDGTLVGDNTDVGGFDAAARALIGEPPARSTVAVLGAGGSAAAVLAAVARWPGATVRLWSRTRARAEALAARSAARSPARVEVSAQPDEAVRDATLVVNATPIGMLDDRMPVAIERLPAGAAVVDLVYRQGETAWARAARAAGHPACDGLPVLIEQGALAFERWFGLTPDREAMRRALD